MALQGAHYWYKVPNGRFECCPEGQKGVISLHLTQNKQHVILLIMNRPFEDEF